MKNTIQLYQYNDTAVKHKNNVDNEGEDMVHDLSIPNYVSWLNFHGFSDKELIESTFRELNIHRLTREDILQLTERPKVEEYESYIYVTLKMLTYDRKSKIASEQVSFILSENNVVSYQERKGDLYDEVRQRIEHDKGIVRKKGADYLLYLLMEGTLVGYEKCLDEIDHEISKANEQLRENFSDETYQFMESIKQRLRVIKAAFHPFREQITKLINSDSSLITESNKPFFNDIRDIILYNLDEIESYKTELESLTNIYFAKMSQRSNEIMQFLTIVASIFIPLTFVAGVYGMNFDNMPELHSKWGYPIVWALMITIALALIIYFRRKKWF